jgi:hypothetical protein
VAGVELAGLGEEGDGDLGKCPGCGLGLGLRRGGGGADSGVLSQQFPRCVTRWRAHPAQSALRIPVLGAKSVPGLRRAGQR